jgi:hypothetical protein
LRLALTKLPPLNAEEFLQLANLHRERRLADRTRFGCRVARRSRSPAASKTRFSKMRGHRPA